MLAFSQLSIIPEPVSTLIKEGHFKFQNNLIIVVNNKEVNYTASAFVKQLSDASGLKVSVSSTGPGAIRLLLNPSPEKKIGDEGYHLDISPDRIEIHANTPAGIYYAVQTLLQLLPKEIESKSLGSSMRFHHGLSPFCMERPDVRCLPPFLHQERS